MPYQDRPQGPTRTARAIQTWAVGDISFLRSSESFSKKDYNDLIASHYLPQKATCHPVIILAIKNNKAIVTPVSAFSTEQNDLLPPWKQKYHRTKKPDFFRSFVGTARPDQKHANLRLADATMKMPKPQASWVYIRSFFCVPLTVLGWFNKSPTLLRVHPDSVAQLKRDMQMFKKQFEEAGARLQALEVENVDIYKRRPG